MSGAFFIPLCSFCSHGWCEGVRLVWCSAVFLLFCAHLPEPWTLKYKGRHISTGGDWWEIFGHCYWGVRNSLQQPQYDPQEQSGVRLKTAQSSRPGSCHMRVSTSDKVDKTLYTWFLETLGKNILLTAQCSWRKSSGLLWPSEKKGSLVALVGSSDLNLYSIVGKTLSGNSDTVSTTDMERW